MDLPENPSENFSEKGIETLIARLTLGQVMNRRWPVLVMAAVQEKRHAHH